METVLSIDLIVSNPAVRNGSPCIAGTGLRVSDLAAAMLFQARSADELASDYGLTMGQVHAALAYYYEHQDDINAEIKRNQEQFEALKEQRIGSRGDSLLS